MVTFFCPPPFLMATAAVSPLTVVFGGTQDGTGFGTTHDYPGAGLGDPTDDRWIVGVSSNNSGAAATGAVIAGIAATFVRQQTGAYTHNMFMAKVPAGTSGLIRLTYSVNANRGGCMWYIVKGSKTLSARLSSAAAGNGTTSFAALNGEVMIVNHYVSSGGVTPGGALLNPITSSGFSMAQSVVGFAAIADGDGAKTLTGAATSRLGAIFSR